METNIHVFELTEDYMKEYVEKYSTKEEKRYVLYLEYMRDCRFLYPNPGEDLVHPTKCQGQQVADQLVIRLYAIRMGHLRNHYLLRILNERRSSTTSLEVRFLGLQTRAYKNCTFPILFELLVDEIARLHTSELNEFVQSFLSEVAPRIHLGLQKYQNTSDEQPGEKKLICANCSLC